MISVLTSQKFSRGVCSRTVGLSRNFAVTALLFDEKNNDNDNADKKRADCTAETDDETFVALWCRGCWEDIIAVSAGRRAEKSGRKSVLSNIELGGLGGWGGSKVVSKDSEVVCEELATKDSLVVSWNAWTQPRNEDVAALASGGG